MKRLIVVIGMLVLITATLASAQQPVVPADPHHPPSRAQTPAPPVQPTPTPPAAGTMPMMEMCREMVGGHSTMGPSMMGSGQPSDPKMMAQMMEMRGEMMEAMGDIMLKHARRMQGKSPAPK